MTAVETVRFGIVRLRIVYAYIQFAVNHHRLIIPDCTDRLQKLAGAGIAIRYHIVGYLHLRQRDDG